MYRPDTKSLAVSKEVRRDCVETCTESFVLAGGRAPVRGRPRLTTRKLSDWLAGEPRKKVIKHCFQIFYH